MTRSLRFATVLFMVVALAAGGCAKKKKNLDESSTDITGAGGESGVAQGSSLDRFKHGLNPEEGGVLKDVTEIEGHCDERGTVEYNLALGARRAKAVKDYLVTLGISGERLSTISYGEELPLCREQNESCYARNRRVHFVPPQ
jgi:hypothetical protein